MGSTFEKVDFKSNYIQYCANHTGIMKIILFACLLAVVASRSIGNSGNGKGNGSKRWVATNIAESVEKKEVEKEPIIENLSSEDNLVEVASNEVGVKNEKPNGNGGRQEGNGNSK